MIRTVSEIVSGGCIYIGIKKTVKNKVLFKVRLPYGISIGLTRLWPPQQTDKHKQTNKTTLRAVQYLMHAADWPISKSVKK